MKIHKITSQQLVRNERYIQKKSRGGGVNLSHPHPDDQIGLREQLKIYEIIKDWNCGHVFQ